MDIERMPFEMIRDLLAEHFGGAIRSSELLTTRPLIFVAAERWLDVARFLRDDGRLGFDWLRCITGVDMFEDGQLAAVYELHATRAPKMSDAAWQIRGELSVEVRVPRGAPHIPSVADIWPAANWHEREAYDLFGIIFDGHPNLRRILCCDDWVGHPLRKDYEFPLEYHGIPAVTELGMPRPRH